MSINKYQPHIIILPEDDANRQIANGFIKCLNVNSDIIQVLPPAKGWTAAINKFETELCRTMETFHNRRVLILVDFDDQFENRFQHIQGKIPDSLNGRVFILGVKTEPEDLRRDVHMSFEEIGTNLTENCPSEISDTWNNTFLIHNIPERDRLVQDVGSFLFV